MISSSTRRHVKAIQVIAFYIGIPVMFFCAGTGVLLVLGLLQRSGWLAAGQVSVSGEGAAVRIDYICPMMCVPAVSEPGRCPVCAMELQAAGGGADERSIVVDPASRRVANIQTVSVRTQALNRTIQSIGELHYDESSLKTITAYTGGRIEELFVDFTGARVREGDRLATLYSPQLHSAAIEYLQALKSNDRRSPLEVVAAANRSLQQNARQKLVELGLSNSQIHAMASDETPKSRVNISAPLSGTVIERLVDEGQTVEEGEPLLRLADLTSVWLLLELFPEDASSVRYAQRVTASVKSIPDEEVSGRVAFVDPNVDPRTRTVSVRVVMDNSDGRLRIGDYAKAKISVPLNQSSGTGLYDPELAGKWISVRHPHIIADEPGRCPLCGEPLVSAESLGFRVEPDVMAESLVVPRTAVLQAAGHSIVYVEEEPGRFAIRRVITGATAEGNLVVKRGLAANEKVAVGGNFLLDSQMQLAGNPSLIDPTRASAPMEMIAGFDATELAAIQMLPENEQSAAIKQMICPVTQFKLGSMGAPPKAKVDGRDVYLCCEGCRDALMKDPQGYLAMLDTIRAEGLEDRTDDAESSAPELPAFGPIQSIDETELAPDQFDSIPPIGEIQLIEPAEGSDQ